jgi:hypothetical protein
VSGQLHAPATLPPGKDHGSKWMAGWVDPRAGQEAVADISDNFLVPAPAENRTSVVHSVAYRYIDRSAPVSTIVTGRFAPKLPSTCRIPSIQTHGSAYS